MSRKTEPKTREQIQLSRFRRLWRFVLVITVALISLTVALNVMHAPPTLRGMLIGGTPPVFVFFCLELVSRIPTTSRWLSVGRVLASIVVAGFSFAVSYEQQREFVFETGFSGWVAYLYPIMIDGVMVVSTLSLIEVTRKVHMLREIVDGAFGPVASQRVADPTLHLENEATKAYRAAIAQYREGEPVVQNVKRTSPVTVAA